MKKRFIFTPDAPAGNTGGAPKSHKKPSIARADADLGTQARLISEKWSANPGITLLWTDSATFKKAVDQYNSDLQERRDTGATRPGTTFSLGDMEAKMEEAIADLKIDIAHKFRKSAIAQYPRYGLLHRYGRWELPTDRDDLLHSIESILAAVAADGFGAGTYGTAFWMDIQKDFNLAFDAAKSTDGAVSGKVADKNTGKEYIRKVIVALRHIIVGNYPDTYAAVLRDWGWQKEDF